MANTTLILGKGFIGSYLAKYYTELAVSFDATTRDGRDGTIKWSIEDSCTSLPKHSQIIITFPVDVPMIKALQTCFPSSKYILLGSTRPYNKVGGRNTRDSPMDTEDTRVVAENYLLAKQGVVLNLAGLWGGERQPMSWIPRVCQNLEKARALQSLHLIHGQDVARVIHAAFGNFMAGERWLVSDNSVYDWWDIVSQNGNDEQKGWIGTCMRETSVTSLPRNKVAFKRYLESTDLWKTFKLTPSVPFVVGSNQKL